MVTDTAAPAPPAHHGLLVASLAAGVVATLIIPVNFVLFVQTEEASPLLVSLALIQLALGIASGVLGITFVSRARPGTSGKVAMILGSIVFIVVGLGGPVGIFLAFLASGLGSIGGAWGRPLRIRGRILHPSLRAGSDWTRGAQPSTADLDPATTRALEALWLHDAQKEHASVPAFSRISWLLAAVGAPAELVEWAHRAALQEIDHARRCFALAAGYGGRSHSVEPMPDLLVGGLDLRGDPFVHLAVESLKDGCLLEDFNADVARCCAQACRNPATRDVLERITVEEREHADFSWALLEWLLVRRRDRVAPAIRKALGDLDRVPRPTAVSADKERLVNAADPTLLRAHGRLPDDAWLALWRSRLELTRERARALLAERPDAGTSIAAAPAAS
jgi:hypothetical protein